MKRMKIIKNWKSLFDNGKAELEGVHGVIIKIKVGKIHIATLYHDDSDYCLTYKPAFKDIGLPPFNPENLDSNEEVKIDYVYRNKDLWFVFAERINALDRRDFTEKMKKLGLTKQSDPLLLLGHLGTISISKPWHLELVKQKA